MDFGLSLEKSMLFCNGFLKGFMGDFGGLGARKSGYLFSEERSTSRARGAGSIDNVGLTLLGRFSKFRDVAASCFFNVFLCLALSCLFGSLFEVILG